MGILETIFSILTFLFIIVPLIGFILLIRYIFKKSDSNQPIHVLNKEKEELISKTRSKKENLIEWKSEHLEKISNDLDYNFSKGITKKFNGYIKTLNNERIISFRRIDRGSSNLTSRIFATTSDFEIYYNQSENEISIEFNGSKLGKITNKTDLIDNTNQNIGYFNRKQSSSNLYVVQINNEKLAYIFKNTDRRNFIFNPFHKTHPSNAIERELIWDQDVEHSNLIKLCRLPNETEYNWLLAIIIYEIIFYGIDFTR